MKVLVTGASGFIGRTVRRTLAGQGHQVRVALRQPLPAPEAAGLQTCIVGEIGPGTDWREAVAGVDAIVHLAGRAHVLDRNAAQVAEAFRAVNVHGAVRLIEAAAAAGVRRFVNIGSIGVLGQDTRGAALTDDSVPQPVNAYTRSKLEAESALAERAGAVELVTLRPPMVYGPDCPGNMLRLLKLVRSGLPLPLGLARGERDMIGIDNLAAAIGTCLAHPAVAGQAYVVCDGEPVSTSALVRMIGRQMGRTPLLLPVPKGLLAGAAGLVGRGEDVRRLFEPLRIDDRRFRRQTGWAPVASLAQGLERTVRSFAPARGHGTEG